MTIVSFIQCESVMLMWALVLAGGVSNPGTALCVGSGKASLHPYPTPILVPPTDVPAQQMALRDNPISNFLLIAIH